MAHHNHTPQSVLDAPKSEPVPVHSTTGPNRSERRHGIPKDWLKPGVQSRPNVPFMRADLNR